MVSFVENASRMHLKGLIYYRVAVFPDLEFFMSNYNPLKVIRI